jgi:hypothetical protein
MIKPTTVHELKILIASNLDVEEFLDIIGWDLGDLVEALEDEIEENFEELLKACD